MKDKASILLVDDRPDKHVVYRAILDDLGQHLVSAMSGDHALKEVLKTEFAVILLDVNMPGMDGLETAELIRGRKRSAHVPIIFVTADYGDEVRSARGYALGAVDFLVSPIVPQILRTKVKVFVDLYRLAQQAKRRARERAALHSERSARAAAERASHRSAFLAQASVVLSGSLNDGETTRELARLAIPFLADVAALTLPAREGVEARTILAWAGELPGQPPRSGSVARVECEWWRGAIERVIANGSGMSFNAGRAATAQRAASKAVLPGSLQVPGGETVESLMIYPLAARGRILGALSLGLGPSRRVFDAELLAVASDFAGRAAIALDNVLLYKELHEQDRRKSEFLAILSHELRNPLAPIMNAVHLLNAQPDDAAQLAWAREVLQRQVGQLRRLVDDLLDVSRITHDKIELKFEPVELAEVVAVAVETVRPLIDARKQALDVTLPDRPTRLRGDFARLGQILANLLNNAAKYTDDGGKITLKAASEGGEAVVRVRDSGVGIPADALASIFEVFRQLAGDAERARGGLGVGLTLVKRLVEMHGGTIEAHSDGPGRGSEFVVRMPLASGSATDAPADDRTSVEGRIVAARQRRRILVADDNVDLAASMGLLLEMMGNDVRLAHDGMSALAAEAEFRPDVVFLDIGMPEMTGFEVCRRIRDKPRGKEPVIVALTGWGQPEDKQRARESGFDHHLVKPIEPAAVERFLAELERQTA